ncbi:MAG TPA: OsmC family protein [Jatrophihabitans sp.]
MSEQRTVHVERLSKARFRATNARGGTIDMGEATGTDFTPVELLLAALAGCTGIDVDYITAKRAEATSLTITVDATKVRDAGGNRLSDIVLSFDASFPGGEGGDAARGVLPDAIAKSHDRLCTVGRTIELGAPITTTIL